MARIRTEQGYKAVGPFEEPAIESICEALEKDSVDLLPHVGSFDLKFFEESPEFGCSLAHLAVYNNAFEVLGHLLSHHLSPDVEDKDGNTPLHVAIALDYRNCFETLITHKANVQHRNEWGGTPLMVAVNNKNVCLLTRLLECGAQINIRNKNGQTALGLAAENYNTQAFMHSFNMQNMGWSINAKEMERCQDIILTLLDYGANLADLYHHGICLTLDLGEWTPRLVNLSSYSPDMIHDHRLGFARFNTNTMQFIMS